MQNNSAFVGDVNTKTDIYVAIYDFVNGSDDDLKYNKHDRFVILKNHGNDWLTARHLETNQVGFVSRKYVVAVNSLESQPWYFADVTRIEAEFHLLHQYENTAGTFLVRPRLENGSPYALSIRVKDTYGHPIVKHYIICEEAGDFFISSNIRCPTLQLLIALYLDDHTNKLNLFQRILTPCHKFKPHTYELSGKYVKQWELEAKDIKITRRLDEGSFSYVDEGSWNGKLIAVKTLKKFSETELAKEIEVLKSLKHKNVITIYGTQKNRIIFEHASKGTLLKYVQNKDLSPSYLHYIAIQIATGMEYLESNNVIHRDLAARNILITQQNIIKISDFGLSRTLVCESSHYQMHSMYPLRWSAIECFAQGKCNIKSDVWSFGILLMELYTKGRTPYEGITNDEVKTLTVQGHRMKQVESVPDNMYGIMLNCWRKSPENRPSFHQLKRQLEEFNL